MTEQMKMTEQMIFLASMGGSRAQKAVEEAWISEYRRHEADKEFGRARRRVIVKRIKRALFGRKKIREVFHAPKPGGFTGRLSIPLDSIVGIVDRAGRDVSTLPALDRKLRKEWRRWYLSDDMEAYPILKVRLGPGGWYLMGGPAALVVVEVLRAKRYETLSVFPAPVENRQDQEEESGCCAEEPKIAS